MRGQFLACGLVLLAVTCARGADDRKWVWSGGSESRRFIEDDDDLHQGRPLYRPSEEFDRPFRGDGFRPPAPVIENTDDQFRPRPPFNQGPANQGGFQGGFQPPRDPRPPGGVFNRPGQGVLSGPREPHGYQEYETCKCAHSFNCKSPGIHFGTCDGDKQYCCYDPKPKGFQGPNRDGDRDGFQIREPSNQRPYLVGPGREEQGGFGYGDRPGPGRPPYDSGYRPGFVGSGPNFGLKGPGGAYRPRGDLNRPVLVGPGGPTGIVDTPRGERFYEVYSRSTKKN